MRNKNTKKEVELGTETKETKKGWAKYLDEAKGLERDYMTELAQSRKRSMLFGWAGMAFGVGMMVWHQLFPLTNTQPHILRVDKATGAVEVISTVPNQTRTMDETINRYWVGTYVRNYEGFAYQSIQHNYDTTLSMSSKTVGGQYMMIYSNENGNVGRDKQLGVQRQRLVKVISITPDSKIDGLAVVRFQTMTTGDSVPENWIATVTYEYVKTAMSDQTRLLNPLGFMVTSYRAEREL